MDFSKSHLLECLDRTVDILVKHKREFFIGLGLTIGLVVGGIGYSIHRNKLQVSAHTTLVAALKVYEASIDPSLDVTKKLTVKMPTQFKTEEEKWNKVQEVFKEAYNNHKGAGIAPYFLTFQAEALSRLTKFDEALQAMTEAIRLMGSPELKAFYQVKLALIKLDSQKHQNEGLTELKKYADDQQGLAHECALYHLGNYFWCKKDFVQARNYWQQLMIKYGLKDTKLQSGYSELARTKLRLISAEF